MQSDEDLTCLKRQSQEPEPMTRRRVLKLPATAAIGLSRQLEHWPLNYCLYGSKQAPACFKAILTEHWYLRALKRAMINRRLQTVWIKDTTNQSSFVQHSWMMFSIALMTLPCTPQIFFANPFAGRALHILLREGQQYLILFRKSWHELAEFILLWEGLC
jgi:hypothetical protein